MNQLIPKLFNGKRYNSYNSYLKLKYGQRVQKVTVDGGFTCPNRDGSVAFGGCTYCNNDSFNPGYNDSSKSITQQIAETIRPELERLKIEKTLYPIFIELPDKTGELEGRVDPIKLLIKRAIGMEVVKGNP